MDGCTCLERNKKMQVRWRWHSEMLTGTWMDAPAWKEIKKKRSVSNGMRECSLGHGWMHLSGKKIKKCRSDGDGIQQSSLGHGWMHLAGKNKCRSIGHGIGSCKCLSGMRFMYLLFQD